MKRAFRHSITGLLLCVLCVLVGCEKPEPYRVTQNDTLYLALSTALLDDADLPGLAAAKAGDGRYLSVDKIRSLRIVLVSQSDDNGSWTVEANEYYTLENTGGYVPSDLTYAISHTQNKRIYLFGNCEGVALQDASGKSVALNAGHDVFIPDATGRAPVDDFRFVCTPGSGNATVDKDDYVPMSAVYDIQLPADIERIPTVGNSHVYTVPKPLYLIRAVTKFTVFYENKTAERAPVNIRVRGWSVSKIAKGASYLLARVDDAWQATTQPKDKTETDWQYWLAKESANTQNSAYKSYEWMYAYDLPEKEHEDYVCTYDSTDRYNLYHTGSPSQLRLKPVYLPESKNLADGEGTYGKQVYELKVRTWEWDDNYNLGRAETYTVVLPECRSLFRNTDVRLNVTFLGDAVSLQVTACPWDTHPLIEIPEFSSLSL